MGSSFNVKSVSLLTYGFGICDGAFVSSDGKNSSSDDLAGLVATLSVMGADVVDETNVVDIGAESRKVGSTVEAYIGVVDVVDGIVVVSDVVVVVVVVGLV